MFSAPEARATMGTDRQMQKTNSATVIRLIDFNILGLLLFVDVFTRYCGKMA
jgi:hypothetical protein